MYVYNKHYINIMYVYNTYIRAGINTYKHTKGPSIKYVTLFLDNFNPPPPVTLRHTSRDSPPKVRHTSRTPHRFLEGLVQKLGQKPLVQILSELFAGVFVRGVLSGSLLSGRFRLGWFLFVPVLSEYI